MRRSFIGSAWIMPLFCARGILVGKRTRVVGAFSVLGARPRDMTTVRTAWKFISSGCVYSTSEAEGYPCGLNSMEP